MKTLLTYLNLNTMLFVGVRGTTVFQIENISGYAFAFNRDAIEEKYRQKQYFLRCFVVCLLLYQEEIFCF